MGSAKLAPPVTVRVQASTPTSKDDAAVAGPRESIDGRAGDDGSATARETRVLLMQGPTRDEGPAASGGDAGAPVRRADAVRVDGALARPEGPRCRFCGVEDVLFGLGLWTASASRTRRCTTSCSRASRTTRRAAVNAFGASVTSSGSIASARGTGPMTIDEAREAEIRAPPLRRAALEGPAPVATQLGVHHEVRPARTRPRHGSRSSPPV